MSVNLDRWFSHCSSEPRSCWVVGGGVAGGVCLRVRREPRALPPFSIREILLPFYILASGMILFGGKKISLLTVGDRLV